MQTTPETVITGDNHAATKGRRCFTGRRINDRGTRGGCQLTDTSSFDALVGKQFSYELLRPLPLSLSRFSSFFVFFLLAFEDSFLAYILFARNLFYFIFISIILYLFIYLFYIYFINLFYILFLILFFILKGILEIFCKLVKVYDTIKCIKYLTSENLKEEKILLCINIILYINLEILNCRKD